ncbi:MAG TPA: hypothetical protein VI997_12485 [Candidatus Thermoplasmatota archaeon]|nr:hypothetical protein [Candidatus Thermoplasmatota archaeon]
MAEKQVLFRLDEALLESLDRKLAQRGFRTRNAWFRTVAEQFVTGERKRNHGRDQDLERP